jgi:hypothetical protein
MPSPWFIRAWLVGAIVLVGISAAPGEDASQRVTFVDRHPVNGPLVGIDSEWNLKFQVGEKISVVPIRDLIYWGSYRDQESGPQILLTDGSVVRADLLELGPDTITIGDASGLGRCLWDESTLPRTAVRGVLFHPPAAALERDKLIERVQIYAGLDDQLLLAGGETIDGRLQQGPRSGRFLPADQATNDVFQLTRKGVSAALEVPAGKVTAIFFGGGGNPILSSSAFSARLGFSDGSLLNAAQVRLKASTVELTLACGGTVAAPLDQPTEEAPTLWRNITWVQPANERVAFLSDLKPIGYKHIPLLTLDWPYGVDRNVLGGRLRSSRAVYLNGVGMHPVSRLAYELDGKYQQFEAEIALDDSTRLQGSVVFKVLVEGEANQWKTAYESPIVRGGDKPQPIAVDVKGARRLALIVDYADHADELDHANWLMARLIP